MELAVPTHNLEPREEDVSILKLVCISRKIYRDKDLTVRVNFTFYLPFEYRDGIHNKLLHKSQSISGNVNGILKI
jgi:hypothetical protein